MQLDKMKIYFEDIQIGHQQNEEFRSSILTSVKAQNIQILHLSSQSAAQQKEMDELKGTVSTLKDNVKRISNVNVSLSKIPLNLLLISPFPIGIDLIFFRI